MKEEIERLKYENHRYDDALKMANKIIDMLSKRITNATKYIENYLHEHVIEDHPDEQSTFYDEQDNFIPNAKEELLNILQGKDEGK